jgi:hypothetical protein
MILLLDEDRKLLRKMESEVSKETMSANFDELMQYPPLHSGSPEEEHAPGAQVHVEHRQGGQRPDAGRHGHDVDQEDTERHPDILPPGRRQGKEKGRAAAEMRGPFPRGRGRGYNDGARTRRARIVVPRGTLIF